MPKRFIDTSLFKKKFIRGCPTEYKLFYVYLFLECDHAGIWEVDLELASFMVGKKQISKEKAFQYFNDGKVRVQEINDTKWFLPGFIDFQYKGQLNPENRAHKSVIELLTKYNLVDSNCKIIEFSQGANKGLTSPWQGCKDKDKDKDKVKDISEKDTPCAFSKSQNFKTRNESLEKYVIKRMSASVYKFDAKDLKRIIENVPCREFVEAVERFRTFRIERGVSSGGSGIGIFFRNFLANYDRFTTDAGREAAVKQYKRWNGGSITDVPKAGKFDREIEASKKLNQMIAELGKGGNND